MTKIIDLPTTTTADANTFVPVYQNGKTKKVSATALGGGGSGSLPSDFTSLSTVSSVDGTEIVAVNKPLGTALRTTVQNILNWILAKTNTWTAKQTFSASLDTSSINGGQLAGLRNKVINASFSINQRNYTSGAATTAGQYTLDRWKVTSTAGITFSTSSNKTTVTIPSGQTIQQVIEGLNIQTGTYILSWSGTAQGRINSGSYGASGTVSASLTGGTSTTIEFNTGTVENVMLEFGSVSTAFENRIYSLELSLCQRYYYRIFPGVVSRALNMAYVFSSTTAVGTSPFPVRMRVPPISLDQSGTASHYVCTFNATNYTVTAVPTLSSTSTEDMGVVIYTTSGMTGGHAGLASASNTAAYLGFSAEL